MNSDDPTDPPVSRARILKAAASLGILGGARHGAPRMMAALCNRIASAAQIALLIRREPALCARLLRVANSPFYGQSRAITTIERALTLLGLDAVSGIVAAACLDHSRSRGHQYSLIDMPGVVQHSVATAAAAEALAILRHPRLAPEAFVAGLLHNLGIVVQVHLDLAGVEAMIHRRQSGDARDLRALESECAVVGHEHCAAVVFEHWGLPESLIVAARDHHDPMAARESHRTLPVLIGLGATLSRETGNGFTLESAQIVRDPRAMAWLGVTDQELDAVVAALPGRVTQLRQMLIAA
jgi:HD-like signal output (HDOD) protein